MSDSVWRLTDSEYEFIKGEVVHLFTRFDVRCIPVSGFEIALKMGVQLISYCSLSLEKRHAALIVSEDGFCLETGGVEFIYYNDAGRSYERQNWTILHEVGHIVLDHTGHGAQEEAEADFFAKYAIAPPILVHKIHPSSWMDIYQYFDISLEASQYAFNYYQKWLHWHFAGNSFTKYEIALVRLCETCTCEQTPGQTIVHEGDDVVWVD